MKTKTTLSALGVAGVELVIEVEVPEHGTEKGIQGPGRERQAISLLVTRLLWLCALISCRCFPVS